MREKGRPRPLARRICLLPTASGDSDWVITRFYESFPSSLCEPSHLALFRPHPEPVRAALARQDVVYVAGGSSANLAAIWRVHEVGPALREAWERGAVMSGVSAGAICWFAAGLTNSLGTGFAPMAGLGFAPGGFCPHADSDPGRLVALRGLVEAGGCRRRWRWTTTRPSTSPARRRRAWWPGCPAAVRVSSAPAAATSHWSRWRSPPRPGRGSRAAEGHRSWTSTTAAAAASPRR